MWERISRSGIARHWNDELSAHIRNIEGQVREEAGVDGEPEVLIGVDRYKGPRGAIAVAFYLLRYVEDVTPQESRETRWVTFDEARVLILFDRLRVLILDAQARLTSATSS